MASNAYVNDLQLFGLLPADLFGQKKRNFQLLPDPPIDGGAVDEGNGIAVDIFPKRILMPPMGHITHIPDAVVANKLPMQPLFPYVTNHMGSVPTEYSSIEEVTAGKKRNFENYKMKC